MTTANGNGKKGKKVGALVIEDKLENLPTVEELLEAPSHQDHQEQALEAAPDKEIENLVQHQESTNKVEGNTNMQETPNTAPSPEEMLRQSRNRAKKEECEVLEDTVVNEYEEQAGQLVASADEEITTALVSAGQDLLGSQDEAVAEMAAAGSEDAMNDANAYDAAYQATLLRRLSQIKTNNARSLRQQMNLVRQHSNAQGGERVKAILDNYAGDAGVKEEKRPLGEVKKPQPLKGFQILPNNNSKK